jgi:hypothetical protein
MPDVKTKKSPDDRAIVVRLESMGAAYDRETAAWIVPAEAVLDLRRLLADIGRPVEWRGAEAA